MPALSVCLNTWTSLWPLRAQGLLSVVRVASTVLILAFLSSNSLPRSDSESFLRFVCTGKALATAVPSKPHCDAGLLTLMPKAHHSGGLELSIGKQWLVR